MPFKYSFHECLKYSTILVINCMALQLSQTLQKILICYNIIIDSKNSNLVISILSLSNLFFTLISNFTKIKSQAFPKLLFAWKKLIIRGMMKVKVGVLWRRFRNVEQQMKLTPDKVYDDAYEEASHHYSALKSAGYDVTLIEWKKDPRKTLESITKEKVDIIFNASSLKEIAFLETFGIPYVGSGIDLVPLNKAQRKEIVAYNKLPTPKFAIADNPKEIPELNLRYPLFVKPINGRASAGISEENIVYKSEDLPNVVKKITETIGQKALIEEFIEGREVTVGIIGYKDPIVMPLVEIKYNSTKTNTFEHKMYDKEIICCPADFTKDVENRIKNIALNIFKSLNAKDYSRIDMIVNKEGIPYFLELNTFPGLTMASEKDEDGKMKVHHGYMGYAAKAAGMSAEELLSKILESAIERYDLRKKKRIIS